MPASTINLLTPFLLTSGLFLADAFRSPTWMGIYVLLTAVFLPRTPSRWIHVSTWLPVWMIVAITLSTIFSVDRFVSVLMIGIPIWAAAAWATMAGLPPTKKFNEGIELTLTILALASATTAVGQMINGRWAFACGLLPENPNFNSAFLAAVSSALAVRGWRHAPSNKPRQRIIRGVALFLAAIVVISPSRIAIPALGAGWFYALAPKFNVRHLIVALLIVLTVVLSIPSNWISKRLRLNENNHRTSIWQVALKAGGERPWTGWGAGNFELAYQRFAFPIETDPARFLRSTQFAHNEPLQIAASFGLPGVIAMIVFLFSLITSARGQRRTSDEETALGGQIPLIISAMVNPVFHRPFLLGLSLWWCNTWHGNISSLSEPKKTNGRFLSGVLFFLAIALLGVSACRHEWAKRNRWSDITRWMPWDAHAWQQRGFSANDRAEALEHFLRAVQESPSNIYYRESLARTWEAGSIQNDLMNAKMHYEAALRLAPSRAIDALALARVNFRMRNFTECLLWAQAARRIEPHYWEADLWVARAQAAQGRRQAARASLTHLRERRGQWAAWYNRVVDDLPQRPLPPSGYEKTILGYDDRVVADELARLRN